MTTSRTGEARSASRRAASNSSTKPFSRTSRPTVPHNWPMGSALAVLLMLVGLLIVFVYIGALAGKNERKAVRA